MVDYNNETTLATPSVDINRVQILERRAYVIQALQKYYNYKYNGATSPTSEIKSKLSSLFWELEETIKRKYPNNNNGLSYEEMFKVLFPEKGKIEFKYIIKVWRQINNMLGEMQLTRIDTKKQYDTTDIEEENKVQSL